MFKSLSVNPNRKVGRIGEYNMAKKNEKVDEKKVGTPVEPITDPDVLVDPAAKANFWKPKDEGETRMGKFLGKSNTQYGEVINLETAKGLCQIPISVVLKKVDWDKHVGKNILFKYEGTIKRYRTFFVKIVK